MLSAPLQLLKRITGARSLGLADLAVRLGTRTGSRSSISEALRQEIRAYYEQDNARLEPRIWRPRRAARR
jgi:hypothetical protein